MLRRTIYFSLDVGSIGDNLTHFARNTLVTLWLTNVTNHNASIIHFVISTSIMHISQGILGRLSQNLHEQGFDFVGCVDSCKSTSRYIFMKVSGAISRKSINQTLIATSTMEDGFVSSFEANSQCMA
ncbi:hypothetical protein MTR_1g066980 [Medicago truncatula]|uniref:Uncharacterized protein n=1 Tax=Medicago truncatula TaxID=3880 RepID=A0A072VLJ7_MEDTR|nr:hypothetical protein MTR_1g066980 [Medicago truncatula]